MAVATSSVAKTFHEQGFVKVEGVLDPETVLDPVIEEYKEVLDSLVSELYEAGEIESEYKGLDFDERILKVYQETGRQHAQYFDFSLPFQDVKEDTPCWFGPAVFHALTNGPTLDVLEDLIGPEISSNPVQHVRIKPPEKFLPKDANGQPIIGATLWHQDHGVVTPEADDTNMVTVWFSLTDTPVESGPLNVVPGSHRGDLLTHCNSYAHNTTMVQGRQIPEKLFEYQSAVPLPTKRGDAIFMHKRTVHGSLPNAGDTMRWSFDLRYHDSESPSGREAFPSFVARSKSNPESELHDPAEWEQMWMETRQRMAKINQGGMHDVPFGRWKDGHPDCEN